MAWIDNASSHFGANWITKAAECFADTWIPTCVAAIAAGIYFVATDGDDGDAGTLAAPFATLGHAHSAAVGGRWVLLRGGTYAIGTSIHLTNDGSAGNPIHVVAYPGEVPVLDAATMTDDGYYDGAVIELDSVRYFHIRGLEIKNGPMFGIALTGTTGDGTLEFLNVHHNGRLSEFEGKGIYVESSGANGIILNCDAHHNWDELGDGSNADGIYLDPGLLGTGWEVRGNRVWRNSDDGIDLFNGRATNNNSGEAVLVEDNWCWENGYVDEDGGPVTTGIGNGMGFKLGGARGGTTGNTSGGHTLTGNLAWKNLADGFAANQATIPITEYNNTAWDNGGAGFECAANVVHVVRNNAAIDNDDGPTNFHANVDDTFNSWNGGVTATAADFASTTPTGVTGARGADGSLPVLTFLRLAAASDLIHAGTAVGLGSDMGAHQRGYNLLDAGVKDLFTTGTIGAASDQLVLASDPGFEVGDAIIVATGGEAGAGVRGTKGVGGVWPALSYANLTAMQADTSQVANTYAWREDTGAVYQWVSSVWTAGAASQYYIGKAVPRALCATIEAINSLTLTLSESSLVAATAAEVFFDNADLINEVTKYDSVINPPNNGIVIPPLGLAVSKRLLVHHHAWELTGSGPTVSRIFSPEGCPSAHLVFYQCTDAAARSFHLEGNARNNGFGLAWDTNLVTETLVTQGDAYPGGIQFGICTDCEVFDTKTTDVFQGGIGVYYGVNVWAFECEVALTEGLQQYIQWMYQWSDSIGGGADDCTLDSAFLTAGFEGFRTNGIQFNRCISRNGLFSMNSTGNFLIDEPSITIEALSQISEASISSQVPIITINSNISPPSPSIELGGLIRNPTIIQEGAINAGNDRLQGIVINALNPNVVIEGGYLDDCEAGGYIEAPDFVPGSNPTVIGVVSDNVAIDVTGIRVVGSEATGLGVIRAPVGSTIQDCVADSIEGAATEIDNVNNATWVAAHPGECD